MDALRTGHRCWQQQERQCSTLCLSDAICSCVLGLPALQCLAAWLSAMSLCCTKKTLRWASPSSTMTMHDMQCQLQADVVAPPNTLMCSANFYEHFIITPTRGVKMFKMFTPASCGACWTCEG